MKVCLQVLLSFLSNIRFFEVGFGTHEVPFGDIFLAQICSDLISSTCHKGISTF